MEQLPTTDQRRNSTLHDPTSDGSGQFKRKRKKKREEKKKEKNKKEKGLAATVLKLIPIKHTKV